MEEENFNKNIIIKKKTIWNIFYIILVILVCGIILYSYLAEDNNKNRISFLENQVNTLDQNIDILKTAGWDLSLQFVNCYNIVYCLNDSNFCPNSNTLQTWNTICLNLDSNKLNEYNIFSK